jgi:class 3 adenylate cyclase
MPPSGDESWAWFEGAVLVVDISGYTPLAERLCAADRHGAETLGSILDNGFNGYLRAVRDAGGEIACFAGDAFIAYWAADDGDVQAVLIRALTCAERLHSMFGHDAPPGKPSQPPVHIGAGAGQMWMARLGIADRVKVLLAGPSVHQACAALSRAQAGHTEVAPEARAFLAVAAKPRNERQLSAVSARPALPLGEWTETTWRRMDDYARAGYPDWIEQRRPICAVFVRIDGIDSLSPASGAPVHQAAAVAIDAAIRPYTSATGAIVFDDKGLVFRVCLGMPHDTHSDDTLRAVRAGLDIRARLSTMGLSCAVGVAAGFGVCMLLGGRYVPVGPFMHVAARFMEAAGQDLLCTEDVAAQVRQWVQLSEGPALSLKGLPLPVRAFRASGELATEVLFGREREQEAIDGYLDQFESQSGRVVLLSGEAGLGKTALVQYLRQRAEQRHIPCLYGAAGSMDIAVPYMAWRGVFSKLLEPAPAEDDSQAARRQRLGALKHELLAPLVNAVVPGYLEDTPLTRRLSGQARADATVSLLTEILATRASSGFLLVLEDCHWLDSPSWRLALHVCQEYPQACIVLTSRPGEEAEELAAIRHLERFVEIALGPLPADAISALVFQVLGARPEREGLVKEIIEIAVGHPLFAREYALLRATNGAKEQSSAVPMTIQALIASRLDALSPSEDLTLKAACVIGDRFSLAVLDGARPGQPQDLATTLARLRRLQFIVQSAEDSPTYEFQHALIREVAYEQLTRAQRSGLHRRVAEVLERTHVEDLPRHFGTLAHHWSRAEVPAPTIKYSDLAAAQALTAGAFQDAERLLDTCVTLGATTDGFTTADQIRWYRGLADARHGLGRLEPRISAAHRALDLGGCHRPGHASQLVAQAGARLVGIGVRRVAAPMLPRPDPVRTMEIARAYRHSAEVCYFNNDMLGMLCDSLSAVAFASRLPPSAVWAGASTELGGIVSAAGLRPVGEWILRRAITIAEAADDQAAQAYAHMINSLYYIGRGRWDEAERSVKRCQDLCEPMDDRVNWTNAQTVRFWMSHYRSRHEGAYEAACALRERANQTGNRQHRAWGLRCLAVCSMQNAALPGDPVADLRSALESLGETAALNERVPTLGLLALALQRAGDAAGARDAAVRGIDTIVRVRRPIGHGTLEGYSALTAVTLNEWQKDRQSERWGSGVQECLRVLRRYSRTFPIGEPRYHLHLGEYQRIMGRPGAARRSYEKGGKAALHLGMPSEARYCAEAVDGLGRS